MSDALRISLDFWTRTQCTRHEMTLWRVSHWHLYILPSSTTTPLITLLSRRWMYFEGVWERFAWKTMPPYTVRRHLVSLARVTCPT